MDSQQLRDEALKETMERAGAFEELVRVKGWEFVKAYIEGKVRFFANKAITEGFKSMEDYQYERGVVNGLRTLLGEVSNTLKILEDERAKKRGE